MKHQWRMKFMRWHRWPCSAASRTCMTCKPHSEGLMRQGEFLVHLVSVCISVCVIQKSKKSKKSLTQPPSAIEPALLKFLGVTSLCQAAAIHCLIASSGFGSAIKARMDSKHLKTLSEGLHESFRISRPQSVFQRLVPLFLFPNAQVQSKHSRNAAEFPQMRVKPLWS